MTAAELTVKITADIRDLEAKLIAASAALREFKSSAEGTGASVNQMARDAETAARELDKVDKQAQATDKSTNRLGSAARFLASNWRFTVPALAAAGLGVFGLATDFGFLGSVIPIATAALGVFLLPLTSLAAIVVAFVPPLLAFLALFGGLGLAFGLSGRQAMAASSHYQWLSNQVAILKDEFKHLLDILAKDFMPYFVALIQAASTAIRYFDKLAHMPLADAFKSLASTGVEKLNKFVESAAHILARPFRLAVAVAFGGGDDLSSTMANWAQQLSHFMFGYTRRISGRGLMEHGGAGSALQHVPGALQPIVDWFNRQDFTATGARWGHELAKGIMYSLGSVLKSALKSSTAVGGGAGGIIGALLGTAINPGIGTVIGGALGAGIGAVIGHYWAPLKAKAVEVWGDIRTFSMGVLHEVGAAIIAFLGAKTWNAIKAAASTTWRVVQQAGRDAFSIVRTTAMLVYAVLRLIWAIVDTIIIKTGLWKVGVELVRAVVYFVARAFQAVVQVIGDVIHWIAKAYNWVAGSGGLTAAVNNLTGAWNAVSGVVGTIVGDIQTAVGWAQSLISVLGQSSGAVTRHNYAAHHSGMPVGRHATGGIITRPLMAMGHLFGEAGPEAVVPLNRARDYGFGGGGGPTINLNGPIIGTNPQLLARELARIIQPYLGNTPSIQIAGA